MDYIDENEELYRAWIGTKNQDKYYEKMKNGGFSWVAFFLSDLLLITRKMFTESIIFIFICYLISTVLNIIEVPRMIYILVNITIGLTIGFSYYPLYKWHIKRKIKKYQRKGLTYEEQLSIARKYGGDKFTFSVIVMILVSIIIVATLMMGNKLFSMIFESAEEVINNNYSTNNSLIIEDISENGDSSSNKQKSSYKVNFENFEFYIPNNLEYEVDYINNVINIGDTENTWVAQLGIIQSSFQQLKQNKSQISSYAGQFLGDDEAMISAATIEKISGVEYILLECNINGTNMLAGYAKLNSMYSLFFQLYSKSNDFARNSLKNMSNIIKNAEYIGDSLY
jgi:hypothetical protein